MVKIDTLINAVRKLETRAIARKLTPKEERQLSCFWDEATAKLLYVPSTEIYGKQMILGKHKLPRFMYHLTTEENYLSMIKDGYIQPSQCMDSSAGIFLFDMKNFVKFWKKTRDVGEQPKTTLLSMIAGKLGYEKQGNVVLLRIPTRILDARKLRLRRQKLCRVGYENLQKQQEAFVNSNFKFSETLEKFKYMNGENVSKFPLYNQRKEAVEFITPEEIPIEAVELVGIANVDGKILDKLDLQCEDVPTIWRQLTENQPEQKAFEVFG